MGTRSLIGKQLNDGSILGVYCHYDGYPEFNGRVLRDNFNTEEKVNKLIDGGDMSCTWTNAGWNNETLPETPQLYKDLNEFLTAADDNYGAEYTYHFVGGEWTCHDVRSNPYTSNNVMQVAIPAGGLSD
jgi:hypothetical protein